MYNWDGELPPLVKAAIEQAGPPILISDTAVEKLGVRPVDIKRWAQKYCKTFIWMEESEVSDVSYVHDYIYAFYIQDEKDRNWFKLRWVNNG